MNAMRLCCRQRPSFGNRGCRSGVYNSFWILLCMRWAGMILPQWEKMTRLLRQPDVGIMGHHPLGKSRIQRFLPRLPMSGSVPADSRIPVNSVWAAGEVGLSRNGPERNIGNRLRLCSQGRYSLFIRSLRLLRGNPAARSS